MARRLIKNIRSLTGTHPPEKGIVAGAEMARLPSIENAWLLIENGRIKDLGPMDRIPSIEENSVAVIDASDRFVLPGWCDPHTHIVFAAPREGEFIDRINGLTYQEIAARGGGILNSARKLRGMPEDLLYDQARTRLEEMMRQGTVAVEIKSGYGLDHESELLMLRVIRRLKETMPIPIKATLLAAHALPPEFSNDRKGYIDMICDRLIPETADQGLADHVDVFCETNYFTVEEMVRVLKAGSEHGLPGKVHVNQFTSIGGIQAAIEHNALSVDHLEVMEEKDIDALAEAWNSQPHPERSRGANSNNQQPPTLPTLLPSCSFFLRIPYAPARSLIEKGLPIALATDHNPGSTPSGNMNFVLSLACIQMRLLPEEAINAMTINSAAAMRIQDEAGSISIGKRANLIITKKIPSLAYMPYAFGSDHIDTVLINGEPFRSGEAVA